MFAVIKPSQHVSRGQDNILRTIRSDKLIAFKTNVFNDFFASSYDERKPLIFLLYHPVTESVRSK
jgi:hypothetical protein